MNAGDYGMLQSSCNVDENALCCLRTSILPVLPKQNRIYSPPILSGHCSAPNHGLLLLYQPQTNGWARWFVDPFKRGESDHRNPCKKTVRGLMAEALVGQKTCSLFTRRVWFNSKVSTKTYLEGARKVLWPAKIVQNLHYLWKKDVASSLSPSIVLCLKMSRRLSSFLWR